MVKRSKLEELIQDAYEDLRSYNYTLANITVPDILGRLPRIIALFLWAAFSLIWVIVAGPICFVIEAILLIAAFMVGVFSGRLASTSARIEEIGYMLQLALCFVLMRFVACADIFDDVVIRRRCKKRY